MKKRKLDPEAWKDGDWTQDIVLHGADEDDYYEDEES